MKRVVDIVIPPDQFGMGGVQAGVLDFILSNLAMGGKFPKDLPHYQLFVSFLIKEEFLIHDTDVQENLLAGLKGEFREAFKFVIEQIQEGYYTSPAGFDLVGWTVTG